MLKYYVLLFLVVGAVLVFVFLQNPCNEQFRSDFAKKYPDYEILDFGGEGDTEEVFCHISYQKPGGQQVYEDVWIYRKSANGWQFSGVQDQNEDEGEDDTIPGL